MRLNFHSGNVVQKSLGRCCHVQYAHRLAFLCDRIFLPQGLDDSDDSALCQPSSRTDRTETMQALVYFIAQAFYNAWFHPLASFPGPWLARTSLVMDMQGRFAKTS
jgi:hypothetical protein